LDQAAFELHSVSIVHLSLSLPVTHTHTHTHTHTPTHTTLSVIFTLLGKVSLFESLVVQIQTDTPTF